MHKSEKFWDKRSKSYEKRAIKNKLAYNITLETTKKYLNMSDIVLECGCGTGTIAIEFADSVKKITATDISMKMIEIAKRKAEERKIENIEFVQSTIFDERLKKESFNVIYAFNVLHLLENIENVMQRINELLIPGGLFISGTVCLREKNILWSFCSFFLNKIGLIPYVNCFKVSELEGFITNEGFKLVETGIYYPNPPRRFIIAKK
jgi:ubiquinone/menaquinone biosynthesis C-methylase UbiE